MRCVTLRAAKTSMGKNLTMPAPITKSQQDVLDSLKQGHEVSGKYIRSIRALEQKGLITNVRCEGKFDPARGYSHEFYQAEIVDLNKLPEPMTFESRVTNDSVQAIFEGEVYYEFKTIAPSVPLLLLQTRIVSYHPKRNPSFHGVYYVDGHTIHAVRRESDVPSGKRMMHNWLLNKRVAEDKERKTK